MFAPPLDPPYLAVIFTSLRSSEDDAGYGETAAAMDALAAAQPGYLGIEAARDAQGFGITVSYWRDAAAVRAWRRVADHLAAQAAGRLRWYRRYHVRVATVERDYGHRA